MLILAQALNVKFIQDLHATEPLMLRMPTVDQPAEAGDQDPAVRGGDRGGPAAARAVGLKQLLKDASDRDLVSLVLKTIRNIVHYKDAFLQTGVIDVLVDHIPILAEHLKLNKRKQKHDDVKEAKFSVLCVRRDWQ